MDRPQSIGQAWRVMQQQEKKIAHLKLMIEAITEKAFWYSKEDSNWWWFNGKRIMPKGED